LDAPKPSCWNEKGSNETQSEIVTCNTKRTPHKISRQMSRVGRVLVIRASLATLILIALFFRRGCDPRLLAPRRSRARCFSRAHRPHMLRYGARSALCRQELFAKGQALEHQTEEKLRDSKGYEHLHHILTVAVTLLHIAIAIATIAIVVRGQRIT
jgi:hypothetical protein